MKLRSGRQITRPKTVHKSKKLVKKSAQIKELKVILNRIPADELRTHIIANGKTEHTVRRIQVQRVTRIIENRELNNGQFNGQVNAIGPSTSMENGDDNRQQIENQGDELERLAQEARLPEFDEPEIEGEEEARNQREQQQQQQQRAQRRRKMDNICNKPEKLNLQNGNIAENWKRFKRQFENFLIATECNEKAANIKVAMFLNMIGDEAVDVFESFNLAADQQADYNAVITAMQNFCKPRKNTVYERYMFYQRNQNDGEQFDTFLMDIRQLARSCEFGDNENEMLRDRIVMGIADKRMQAKLLEAQALTYDNAVDKCRAGEATKEQTKQMNKTVDVEEVRAQQKQTQAKNEGNNNTQENFNGNARKYTNNTNQNKYLNQNRYNNNQYRSQPNLSRGNTNTINANNSCKYCDRTHGPRNCPAYGKNCSACSKPNHFAVVCRARQRAVDNVNATDSNSINATDFENDYYITSIESVLTTQESELFLKKQNANERVESKNGKVPRVDAVNSGNPVWKEDLKVNDKFVSFKVDSGSGVGVLPKRIYDIVAPNQELLPSSRLLRAFGGGIVKPLGTCRLLCKFKYRGVILTRWLEFEVVDIDTVPLLGLIGAIKFKLIDIRHVQNYKNEAENKPNPFL